MAPPSFFPTVFLLSPVIRHSAFFLFFPLYVSRRKFYGPISFVGYNLFRLSFSYAPSDSSPGNSTRLLDSLFCSVFVGGTSHSTLIPFEKSCGDEGKEKEKKSPGIRKKEDIWCFVLPRVLLNICILYAQKRASRLQIFTATSCQPRVVKHVVWDSSWKALRFVPCAGPFPTLQTIVRVFVLIFLPRLPPQNLFTLSEFTLWPFLTAFYFIFRFDSLSRGDESSFTVAVSPLHHITRRIFFFFFPLPTPLSKLYTAGQQQQQLILFIGPPLFSAPFRNWSRWFVPFQFFFDYISPKPLIQNVNTRLSLVSLRQHLRIETNILFISRDRQCD